MLKIDVTAGAALPDVGKAPTGFPAGASAVPEKPPVGSGLPFPPAQQAFAQHVTSSGRGCRACGISRSSALLRIAGVRRPCDGFLRIRGHLLKIAAPLRECWRRFCTVSIPSAPQSAGIATAICRRVMGSPAPKQRHQPVTMPWAAAQRTASHRASAPTIEKERRCSALAFRPPATGEGHQADRGRSPRPERMRVVRPEGDPWLTAQSDRL